MFPSVYSTFTHPAATDRLNNPSHSALENSQSSTIGQLEATIGLSGDGPGTIIGDLRSTSSDGGGHIQGVNKGGTGLTGYTKGDLLVATSSSVLAKLTVGADGTALIADSTASPGVKWFPAVANKIVFSQSIASYADSIFVSNNNVLFATSITGGTLGTSNAIRFTGTITKFTQRSGEAYTFQANYGNNMVASVILRSKSTLTNAASIESGLVEGVLGGNSVSSQLGYIRISTGYTYIDGGAATWGSGLGHGNSSINSALDQNLIITAKGTGTGTDASILTGLFLVEKIA